MNSGQLGDKPVVIVTGSGTGIGFATAEMLVQHGVRIVMIGRRTEVLQAAATRLRAQGADGILLTPADVAREDEVRRSIERTIEVFGRIDGLVNNAGVALFASIEAADMFDLEHMLDTHVRGPIHLIRAALPWLRRTQGVIVNVASIGGVLALPNRSLYGATKAALIHLTRSLARELAPEVRVNAVLPGPVHTPIYDALSEGSQDLDALKKEMVDTTPAGRFGHPREVARWICAILDKDSSWMTGALVTVDGGRSC